MALENPLPIFQTLVKKKRDYTKISLFLITLLQVKFQVCVSFHHVCDDEMEDVGGKITLYYNTQFECLLSLMSGLNVKVSNTHLNRQLFLFFVSSRETNKHKHAVQGKQTNINMLKA